MALDMTRIDPHSETTASHTSGRRVKRTLSHLFTIVGFLALAAPPAAAETVVPETVSYWATSKDTAEAMLCELLLEAESSVDKQTLRFGLVVGLDYETNSLAAGYLVGVADRGADGRSIVPLATARFIADTFDRTDLPQEVDDDHAIWTWLEGPGTASRFMTAFVTGGFRIAFTRVGAPADLRSYVIRQGPPADVQQKFATCTQALLPERQPEKSTN